MLLNTLLALTGYLVFSFLLTAMLVRFAGKSEVAQIAKKRFYFFPVVPVMIIIVLVGLIIKWTFIIMFAYPFKLIQRAFEILSGHKRRRRKTSYYHY